MMRARSFSLLLGLLAATSTASCFDPVHSDAVDALFASIGEVYGGAVVAVILTGMGNDGMRGAEILRAQGASVIAQDEASSVVWGMPGAVVNAGLADHVLPLDQVVPQILRMAN